MPRKALRLGLLLAAGFLLAESGPAAPAGYGQENAARLDGIFSAGRKAFYQELRLGFGLHPRRFRLIPGDAQKMLAAEREIPYLYERIINLAYIRSAKDWGQLPNKSDGASTAEFESRFVALSREAAALFVQSLLEDPVREGPGAGILPGPEQSHLQLILSSLGETSVEPRRPRKEDERPLSEDPSGFWGLDVIRAQSAQSVSRGKGVRIDVLSPGPCEPARTGRTPAPPLVIPLGEGTRAPWLEAAGSADLFSPAGAWAAFLVAAVAPESDIRVIAINAEASPQYPFWTAYQLGQGVYKAVDGGADIVLVTAALGRDYRFLKDACDYAYRNNVVVVCPNAAGFSGQGDPEKPTHFPAHYNTTVAVAGVVPGGRGIPVPWEKSEASHYTTCAAPTAVGRARGPALSGFPGPDNSSAAALVAGTAALICSLLPKTGEELSGQYVQRIYEVLCRSCDSTTLGGGPFDPRTGYGLIDADRAVRREVPAYLEKMNRVEAAFKKRMEERAAEQKKE